MILFIKGIFCFILLLSFLRGIKILDFILYRFPLCTQLIPGWSFFATTPNTFDYHLLYREINNQQVEEWQDLYTLEEKRSIYSFLWNPEHRFTKAFVDLAVDLINFSHTAKDKRQVYISLSYLQILNYVDSLNHKPFSEKVQFLILTNSRAHDYKVMFLSDVHPISKR